MPRLVTLAALLVSTLPAGAQTTLLSIPTESAGPAAVAPDMNGDGVRDLLVGDPGTFVQPARPGRVTVHSGVDGALLFTWDGEQVGDGYGTSLTALTDVDGDHVADLAFGAPEATALAGHLPYVHVVSGATGALLLRIEGPAQLSSYATALASLGDVDGDGAGDFAVGASGNSVWWLGASEPGFAEVISGASGAVLWRTPDVAPGLPVAVARHPDLDGDGTSELVVGFAGEDRVEVRAGATGAVLRTHVPPPGLGFGYKIGFGGSVAAGRDLDGDDVADIAVGAPYELLVAPCIGCYEGTPAGGGVYVVSGVDGAVVQRFTGGPGEIGLGTSLALIGDADLDGVDDLVTGNPQLKGGCCNYQPGSVRLHSAHKSVPINSLGYGSWGLVSAAGDWDRDGSGDFLVGGRLVQYGPPAAQYATQLISSGLPPPTSLWVCMSAPYGCYPYPWATGAPSSSGSDGFTLRTPWPSATSGFLVVGTGPLTAPMGTTGPCISGVFARLPGTLTSPPGGGPPSQCPDTLSRELSELVTDFPPGTTLYAQFLSPPGAGTSVTSGVVAFTVWP